MTETATLAPPASEVENTAPAKKSRRCQRVLHVVNGEHFAGAERVQDLLAARLPDYGFEAGFVTLKQGAFAVHRKTKSAPCVSAAMMGPWDVSAGWRAAQLIREAECALIHTHTPRSLVIGSIAAVLTRRPLVHHVHSPTSRDTEWAWKNRLNSVVERVAARRASALITVSQSLHDYVKNKGLEPPTTVIRNGVPEVGPLPDRRPPSGEWRIGVAALFRPRKGVEVLLEAIARLRAAGRRVRLVGVGRFESTEYADAIRRLTGEMRMGDCVEWTGFQNDVTAAMRKMDLFVLPSLYGEGMPMVVLEAMAAGVPVVASRVEGVGEAIEDGRTGLLVEPGDADALAAQIARVLDGEVAWDALRTAAHARQAAEFSDRVMASRVAEVYRQVLEA